MVLKQKIGIVVSDKMNKSIVVAIDTKDINIICMEKLWRKQNVILFMIQKIVVALVKLF